MVQVFGWYGNSNVGDESYKIAFPKLFPGLPFEFLNVVRPGMVADSFIIGGGDILSPSYLNQVPNVNSKRKLVISASATKNTPVESLRSFDQIFVRDRFSVRFFEEHGIPARFMPDISLCLEPNRLRGKAYVESLFRAEKLELREKRIGVVVNAYLSDSGSDDALARDFLIFHRFAYELARIMDNMDASFIFFPMCTRMPADDRITNGIVAERCKFWSKNIVIHERLGVQETLDLIASMDLVISSRLHSSIFSVISQVPFIDITHHDKAKHFLETFSLEQFGLSYWNFVPKEIVDRMSDILNDPRAVKSRLSSVYQQELGILYREAANVLLLEQR